MHTQKKTAAAERALQTTLLAAAAAANALPPSAPDEPKAEPELPAEVRQEQAARLTRTFGTRSENLATLWLNQLMSALPAAQDASPADLLARVWPAINGIAPQDEIEAMLAVQMVAVHNVALNQLHRAAHPNDYAATGHAAAGNAAKLLRVFREQLQALQRYRGKGQQKVTVEHVHVHAGGQAIVGNVEAPQGRGERG
jgi:hypothetical protein